MTTRDRAGKRNAGTPPDELIVMRTHVPALVLALLLSGCGGAVPEAPGAGAPAAGEDGCPLAADALSAATAQTWQLRTTRAGEQHLTLPSVTLDTTCLFTADAEVDEFGDPLTLRVDVATGAAVTQVQEAFRSTCTGNDGRVAPARSVADAQVCRRDGQVQEGIVVRDGRAIEVYYPLVSRSLAEDVTLSFGKVLEAVR